MTSDGKRNPANSDPGAATRRVDLIAPGCSTVRPIVLGSNAAVPFGQVVDVLVSRRRNREAARRFFQRALTASAEPVEVRTDRAAVYPSVLDELLPAAAHVSDRYANNRVEADHGRLKARLRPMRGQCADSNGTAPCGSSRPATRSCRTSDGATTNSPSTYPHKTQSPPPSPN